MKSPAAPPPRLVLLLDLHFGHQDQQGWGLGSRHLLGGKRGGTQSWGPCRGHGAWAREGSSRSRSETQPQVHMATHQSGRKHSAELVWKARLPTFLRRHGFCVFKAAPLGMAAAVAAPFVWGFHFPEAGLSTLPHRPGQKLRVNAMHPSTLGQFHSVEFLLLARGCWTQDLSVYPARAISRLLGALTHTEPRSPACSVQSDPAESRASVKAPRLESLLGSQDSRNGVF